MSGWRSPGEAGGFADWVLELRGYSGVYAIRAVRDGELLYIGESHSGRLYETMTRHFQSSSSMYKGPTYHREACEVRAEVCAARDAIDLQYEWLVKYRPSDNQLVAADDDEGIPF